MTSPILSGTSLFQESHSLTSSSLKKVGPSLFGCCNSEMNSRTRFFWKRSGGRVRAAAPGPSLSELLESEKRRVRSPMNPEKNSHEHRKTTIIRGMHALSALTLARQSNPHSPRRPKRTAHCHWLSLHTCFHGPYPKAMRTIPRHRGVHSALQRKTPAWIVAGCGRSARTAVDV